MKCQMLVLSTLLAVAASADTMWNGGTSADWSAEGAWAGSGDNWLFGGKGAGYLSTEPHHVLFSKAESVPKVWVENGEKGKVLWGLAPGAAAGAGLTMTSGLVVGSNTHGEMIVDGGTHVCKGELDVAQGAAVSELTVNGGSLEVNNYVCIGHSGAGKGTLNVNGGILRETYRNFIIGRQAEGEFNQTGGEVTTSAEVFLAESTALGVMNISGGTFTIGSWMSAPRGAGRRGEINLTGGTLIGKNTFQLGYGENSTGVLTIDGGTLEARNTLYVGYGKGSVADVVLKSGTLQAANSIVLAQGGSGSLTMTGGDVVVAAGKTLSLGRNDSSSLSAAVELNGGTLHVDTVNMSTSTPTKSFVVNGGAFAPVSNAASWLSGATFKVGENGFGVNANGFAPTLSATLEPVDAETPVRVVFHCDMREVGFAEATLNQVDAFVLGDGGTCSVTKGGTVGASKPIELAQGGRIVIDMTGVTEAGTYELASFPNGLTLADGVTLNAETVVLNGLPGGADADYSLSASGVLSVTLGSMEKLVWNADNVSWTAANAWRGADSGVAKTFGATDKAQFVIDADDTVQTVLVNETVAPKGVEVLVTGSNSYPLVKGHGTFAPESLAVKGTIGFAGDAEGALVLNLANETAAEGESKLGRALVASGTVRLVSDLRMDTTIDGTLLRDTDWQPTCEVGGSGEIVVKDATLTVNAFDCLAGFAGTLSVLNGRLDPNAAENHDGSRSILGAAKTIRLENATVASPSQSGGTVEEWYRATFVIGGDEENTISNTQSRDNHGCKLYFQGGFTGSGRVTIASNTDANYGRTTNFECDNTSFTGTMKVIGSSTFIFADNSAALPQGKLLVDGKVQFPAACHEPTFGAFEMLTDRTIENVVPGTVLTMGATGDSLLRGTWAGQPLTIRKIGASALTVQNLTAVDGTVLSVDAGCLNLGGTTAENVAITFAAGTKVRATADGALTDRKTVYPLVTVKSVSWTEKPTVVDAEGNPLKGWSVRKVANGNGTVTLSAVYNQGLIVVIL